MKLDIQHSSSALVLPDHYLLISHPDNSGFKMEKDFYKHVAIIASISNKEASWEMVKNGEANAECYICATEEFADSHKVHLNSYALRMRDIKGVTVGVTWIMPDAVIKSIYENLRNLTLVWSPYNRMPRESLRKFARMLLSKGLRTYIFRSMKIFVKSYIESMGTSFFNQKKDVMREY